MRFHYCYDIVLLHVCFGKVVFGLLAEGRDITIVYCHGFGWGDWNFLFQTDWNWFGVLGRGLGGGGGFTFRSSV